MGTFTFATVLVLGTALVTAAPVAAATNDTVPSQPSTWNFAQARVTGAQLLGQDGRGVVVAVVDGFVDATHPDFQTDESNPLAPRTSRVLAGADCRSGTCSPGPATADTCGHGTHVAGTIASTTYGVAPEASILPVTVLAQDSNGTCSGSPEAVAAAIVWAATHGARIINLSLGDGAGPALLQGTLVTTAIQAAAADGALVVAAAGNNGNAQGAPDYGDDALVVGATGPDGQIAPYSNRGSHVELAAPGGDAGNGACSAEDCIASTWLDHGYALLSGTSMAAPVVSGAAALLLGANPRLGRTALMMALRTTASAVPGATDGLVDVLQAVRSVTSDPSTPPAGPSSTASTPSNLVVPASRPPLVEATRSPEHSALTGSVAGHESGPRGPWQVALLLIIAVGIASTAALLRRPD